MNFLRLVAVVGSFACSAAGGAQSVTEHLASGDREYAALNGVAALAHFEAAATADPTSYEAAWKASRSAIDLGEYEKNGKRRDSLFLTSERYAKRAVELKEGDAEGHFSLARALGRRALSVGKRERIQYGKRVREEALRCLELDSKHAGCLHVMGVWNAEIMRLNGVLRFIAKNFLGGEVFEGASWKEARRYMEAAVSNDPERITHRLDLGRVYADMGEKTRARAEFEAVAKGAIRDFNDNHYKVEAERALKDL
jgi:tetratricopeptide (TPR) repeat protein